MDELTPPYWVVHEADKAALSLELKESGIDGRDYDLIGGEEGSVYIRPGGGNLAAYPPVLDHEGYESEFIGGLVIKGVDFGVPAIDVDEDASKSSVRNQCARRLVSTGRFATFEDTNHLLFCEGNNVWRSNGERVAREWITKILPDDVNPWAYRHITEVIKAQTYVERENFGAPEGFIPVENGLLDPDTMELRGIRPEDHILHKHPVKYDPEGECRRFVDFLMEMVPRAESRSKLQEIAGYTLMHWGQPFKKFFVLVGPTDSGKTTFINIIEALHPQRCVSHRTIQNLAGYDFALNKLYGKMLNSCAELPDDEVRGTGTIKRITGGDSIEAEVKGSDNPIRFKPVVKLLFSCNETPRIRGKDEATLNRLEMVVFPNRKPEPEQDKRLKNKIINNELSGILNWALEGYERLTEQQYFTDQTSVEGANDLLMKWGNALMRFIEFECERGADLFYPKDEFMRDYSGFCMSEGKPAVGKGMVTRELEKMGIGTGQRGDRKTREWSYTTIGPRGENGEEDKKYF